MTPYKQQIEFISSQKMLEEVMVLHDFPYTVQLSVQRLLDQLSQTSTDSPYLSVQKSSLGQLEAELQQFDGNIKQLSDTLEMGFANLFSMLFPEGLRSGNMGMISDPFVGNVIYSSPAFKDTFFHEDVEMPIIPIASKEKRKWRILEAGILILNRFYGQNLETLGQQIFSVRDRKSGLEKHFRMEFLTNGIEVVELQPKKELSDAQIQELLTNLDHPELWLEYLPPDHFAFQGLIFINMLEITKMEIGSRLRASVFQNIAKPNPAELLPEIIAAIRSYLKIPELQVGFVSHKMPGTLDIPPIVSINSEAGFILREILEMSVDYKKVIESEHHLIFSDLQQSETLDPIRQTMIEKGIRSFALIPIISVEGEVLGIIEMASPLPNQLNDTHVLMLGDIRAMMAFGLQGNLHSFDQQIDLVIQQQFTSIHPSVEWKFKEIATRMFFAKVDPSLKQTIDPIVFRDVHPLYGQADIVGSSTIRNRSIRSDLLLNLELVMELLQACKERVHYPLLDANLLKTEQFLAELKDNYLSSHESLVVEFLNEEIHPFLIEICEVPDNKVQELVDRYMAELDPDLLIIYRDRKAYEQSVSMLNIGISSLLEKSNNKMQKSLPHFFEYFKTDGVEYNMYVGSSISPTYPFSIFQLRNIRLWQLVNMCEITRLVYNMQEELPVPLETAQLIFVYNNSLSIRFRMDEKQFDVDGAYNVRFEIIKKRIDKSVIKDTHERLTVKGKIAIVYLQEKDRKEYLEYFDYLTKRGYIDKEIEDLELEKLQGVEGLRALRIKVKPE